MKWHKNNDVKCHQEISTGQPAEHAHAWTFMLLCKHTMGSEWVSCTSLNKTLPILFCFLKKKNVLFLTLIMWFGWKWAYSYGSHQNLACTDWSQMSTWAALGHLEHFPGFQNLGWERVRWNAQSCWWPCVLSYGGSLSERMKHTCRENQRWDKDKEFWQLWRPWFHWL